MIYGETEKVNETLSYIPILSKGNSDNKTKKVTTKNIVNLVNTIVTNTTIYGTLSALTGNIAEKAIPVNKGWFKPQKFKSCFSGKYALKVHGQSAIQTSLLYTVDNVKHSPYYHQQQESVVAIFPN